MDINCAALSKELVESELFGHVKGAFSGAIVNKDGSIDKAVGGTLFLDEIAELSDGVHPKLLRVLESGGYFRVGDTRERRVNFRLIAATRKDLSNPATGFRADLFFRFNGTSFHLPPLSDRAQNIALSVRVFIDEANYDYLKQVAEIEADAVAALKSYNWPGNLRKLKWVIHRAVAVASGTILTIDDLTTSPEVFLSRVAPPSDKPTLSFRNEIAAIDRQRITSAMAETNGNRMEAALALGISVRTLPCKLRKYGI